MSRNGAGGGSCTRVGESRTLLVAVAVAETVVVEAAAGVVVALASSSPFPAKVEQCSPAAKLCCPRSMSLLGFRSTGLLEPGDMLPLLCVRRRPSSASSSRVCLNVSYGRNRVQKATDGRRVKHPQVDD